MKFELEFFEELILQEHGETFSTSDQSLVPEFTHKKQLIRDEVERIKKSFRSSLFSTDSEERIELYIQHHQAHIIHLADQLTKCFEGDETIHIDQLAEVHSKLNLCKILYKSLEELLTYIETYFSKYFNQNAKIPYAYATMQSKEIAEKLQLIQNTVEQKKVSQHFMEVVLNPLYEFVKDPSSRDITFRRLIYFKQLGKDLIAILLNDKISNYDDEIFDLMIYLNFNAYQFLTYSTKLISNEIQNLSSLTEQLEHLSYWIKRINQQQAKPGFAFKCHRTSIHDQLSTWLAEELHFIEKKKQLTLMIPPADSAAGKDDFKVNTILSVQQLAYTIRIFREAGIITNSNQSELMRFFSKHFSSERNENISPESLRTKYYNLEESTINSLQEMLAVLTNQTKKDLKSIFEKPR